jgi:hypothetical protein
MARKIHGFLHISQVDAFVNVRRLEEVLAPRRP